MVVGAEISAGQAAFCPGRSGCGAPFGAAVPLGVHNYEVRNKPLPYAIRWHEVVAVDKKSPDTKEKIILPKGLQREMVKFFLKTSVPKLAELNKEQSSPKKTKVKI
jgi:hypothetical protein